MEWKLVSKIVLSFKASRKKHASWKVNTHLSNLKQIWTKLAWCDSIPHTLKIRILRQVVKTPDKIRYAYSIF